MRDIRGNKVEKEIESITRERGFDSRYDDVVIKFKDGGSILIQGDFSLTFYDTDNKEIKDPDVYSYNGTPKISDIIELDK